MPCTTVFSLLSNWTHQTGLAQSASACSVNRIFPGNGVHYAWTYKYIPTTSKLPRKIPYSTEEWLKAKKKQLEVVLPSQLIQAVSLSREISQKRMPGMTRQAFMYGVGSWYSWQDFGWEPVLLSQDFNRFPLQPLSVPCFSSSSHWNGRDVAESHCSVSAQSCNTHSRIRCNTAFCSSSALKVFSLIFVILYSAVLLTNRFDIE